MFDRVLLHSSANNAIVNFTTVLEIPAFCPHTRLKTLRLLVNCIANDALVLAVPNFEQALLQFLQFVNALLLRLIHSLPDVTPYLVIDRIKVDAVRRPQI